MKSEDIDEIDVRVEIHMLDNASIFLDPDHFDRVDAAWTEYVDTGKTRDRIIDITAPSGAEARVMLSRILCLDRTTRESRRQARARSLYFDREAKEDGIIDT
jgi:hypothetical protein